MPSTGRSGDKRHDRLDERNRERDEHLEAHPEPEHGRRKDDLVAVQREQAQGEQHGRERDQADQRIAVDCREVRLSHLLK